MGKNICPLLVGCALLIPAAYCWGRQVGHGTTQGQSPNLVEALKRDSSGADDGDVKLPSDLERIVKTHDLQAIPVLEEIFDQRRSRTLGVDTLLSKIPPPPHQVEDSYETEELNWENELHIASVLIRLGVKDDVYWDYLAEQARTSLKINIPFPIKTDAQEGPNPPMNPKFITWARSRNRDQNVAFMFEFSVLPSPVSFLAVTNDPRGISLLRQSLTSINPMIRISAAEGLAQLRDKESVPLIIAACKKASASERTALAESLPYFDDPQAQTYAALNLPKNTYLSIRQRIAQGHTPFK